MPFLDFDGLIFNDDCQALLCRSYHRTNVPYGIDLGLGSIYQLHTQLLVVYHLKCNLYFV